jgi:hypothetical protein
LEIIEVRKNPEASKPLNDPTDTNSQPFPSADEKKEQPVEILIESDEEPKPVVEIQE